MVDQIAALIYDIIFPDTHAEYLVGDSITTVPSDHGPGEEEVLVVIQFEREHAGRYNIWGGPYNSTYNIWFYADHARLWTNRYYYTDRNFPDNLLEDIVRLLQRSQLPRWVQRTRK